MKKKFITAATVAVVAAISIGFGVQTFGKNAQIAAASSTEAEVEAYFESVEAETAPTAETVAEVAPVEEAPAEVAPAGNTMDVAGFTVTVADWDESGEKYNRDEQFGKGWKDVTGNGCDTRNDVLLRDLTDVTFRDNKFCVIDTGTHNDIYTGITQGFKYGKKTSALTQIDHVVPLQPVWYSTAQTWTQEQRVEFANDPLNLVASVGSFNSWKNARNADNILNSADTQMTHQEGRCFYVQRYAEVAAKYTLNVSTADATALHNEWVNKCQ